ncbi:unnamed protein product [Allacma fusca]|uniref:Uncharacterized protein n=1 Tax=Allacma fusca TaxID=39272 RepID=A0A8J2L8Q6_9HEXA|nr:unnamed protein product [Allacma fusca]
MRRSSKEFSAGRGTFVGIDFQSEESTESFQGARKSEGNSRIATGVVISLFALTVFIVLIVLLFLIVTLVKQ